MPTINYTFTTPGNYTTSNAEITGDIGRAGITTDNITYTNPIASDAGFTYDNTKAEFTSGLVRAKDQTPTNSIFASTFASNQNLLWRKDGGSLTGALNGSPTFIGGKLVCTGAQGANWDYTTAAIETHKFKYTPNYTTAPPTNVNLFTSWNGVNNNDRFNVINSPSGNNIRFELRNASGGTVAGLTISGAFNPVAGTEYEFEVIVNSTAGYVRIFINGVLLGTNNYTPWTRGGIASKAHLGANAVAYNQAAGSFDDYIYFTNAQHTASYTPGYTITPFRFAETAITAAEVPHTGPGSIISVESFSATEIGSPRYTVQIDQSGDFLYWNGSTWAVSNGTYAQASTVAQFNTNKALIPANGAQYGQFKLHFPDSNTVQTSVDLYSVTLNQNRYFSSASIKTNSSVTADALTSLAATATTPTNTSIKYGIIVDGSTKYWNGSAWVTSNETEAQLNDVSTINTNAASLLGTQNSTLQLHVGLFTSDQTVTASIDEASLVYDFGATASDTPETCIVWGYVNDIAGNPISDVNVSVRVADVAAEYREAASRILGYTQSTTSDSTGYWQMTLIRSSEFQSTGLYRIAFSKDGVLNVSRKNNADITFLVPDLTSVDISTLI